MEYVASGANLADLPSRGEFALLAAMGSERFDASLPPVGGDWAAVFRALQRRPSAGAKRARAELDSELAAARARQRR